MIPLPTIIKVSILTYTLNNTPLTGVKIIKQYGNSSTAGVRNGHFNPNLGMRNSGNYGANTPHIFSVIAHMIITLVTINKIHVELKQPLHINPSEWQCIVVDRRHCWNNFC
jgi:hypothetical protein